MAYLYLALAIIAEVIATSSLKATEEFTKPVPTLIMVAGYGLAFYFMTLTLRSIPLGIVLISIMGIILYDERLDLAAVIGMALIITGVVIIHVFSDGVRH